MTLATQNYLKRTLPQLQAAFCLDDERFRPVMKVNGAMWALDRTALEIDALLDLGVEGLIGFNVSTSPGESARRELRILARSIEHYRLTGGMRPLRMTFAEVRRLMLPHDKPVISGVELQRSLNCDSGHVINLIEAGRLATVPGTTWSQGRGCTASVVTESYVSFLKQRLLRPL